MRQSIPISRTRNEHTICTITDELLVIIKTNPTLAGHHNWDWEIRSCVLTAYKVTLSYLSSPIWHESSGWKLFHVRIYEWVPRGSTSSVYHCQWKGNYNSLVDIASVFCFVSIIIRSWTHKYEYLHRGGNNVPCLTISPGLKQSLFLAPSMLQFSWATFSQVQMKKEKGRKNEMRTNKEKWCEMYNYTNMFEQVITCQNNELKSIITWMEKRIPVFYG